MHIEEYFQIVKETISNCGFVVSSQVSFDARTSHIGYIKAILYFVDGSQLHFREYVDIRIQVLKEDYSYHYQKENRLIFRYDNAPHHREISSFPHHKHLDSEENVVSTSEPSLVIILIEIEDLIGRI
ncbi:MAG: DUF6516 family protein [Nitrospirota bacterium]